MSQRYACIYTTRLLNPLQIHKATHREFVIIFNRMRLIIVPLQIYIFFFVVVNLTTTATSLPMSKCWRRNHMKKKAKRSYNNRTISERMAIAAFEMVVLSWQNNIRHMNAFLASNKAGKIRPAFVAHFFTLAPR